MANLKTSYLGLELDNPFIVGACGLTKTAERVKRCAEAGAGAVVLKSLFEEQIRLEMAETTDALAAELHPEALQYLEADIAAQQGPRQYLELIREASRSVSIPVIASVNCTGAETWVEFAEQIAAAGPAALELNVYVLATDPDRTSGEIEQVYLDTLAAVKSRVKIPVAVKLAPYLSNVGRMALGLEAGGADGLVLFNRLFYPDVDLDHEQLKGVLGLSHPGDHRRTLRWTALLADRMQGDLCATTGIHDGLTAAKMLLVGARAVQVVSVLYRKKLDVLGEMLADLNTWMDQQGYADLDAFRGKLSHAKIADADKFERAQYIKAFAGVE
jgi:dihydroorotate dehydrogenase (fumarate)